VNYWTQNLYDCERISEIIEMSPRVFDERVRQKIFRDVDLGDPLMPVDSSGNVTIDETTPYELVEQHTFLKIGEDDFEKPYIVTFERTSGEVLRISPRFRHEDMVKMMQGRS
jgi:Ser-tRNA(Ala) deacylase AlaX